MIVAVLVVRQNPVEPLPQHRQERMVRIEPGIDQTRRHPSGIIPTLIQLSDGQQAGITGDLALVRSDNEETIREEIEHELVNSLPSHSRPPCLRELGL